MAKITAIHQQRSRWNKILEDLLYATQFSTFPSSITTDRRSQNVFWYPSEGDLFSGWGYPPFEQQGSCGLLSKEIGQKLMGGFFK